MPKIGILRRVGVMKLIVQAIRTLIIYLFLTLVIRLLGKRQIGQLQVSEFVSTLLISEIAAVPITDGSKNLLTAIIPISLIGVLEYTVPILLFRYPKIRRTVEGTPSYLVKRGKIDQGEMKKNRISPEEFLSILRTSGIADPTEVEYAVLEPSGTVSVFTKIKDSAPTYSDFSKIKTPKEKGIAHALIMQGVFNRSVIKRLSMDEDEIRAYLDREQIRLEDVFLLSIDDSGRRSLIVKTKG